MTMASEKIEAIVKRIVEVVHPDYVYLFGSQVNGTAREDSDIDLLIIADMEGSRRKRNLRIQQLFPMRNFAMDVFVFKPKEFERHKRLINSISYIVSKEGKIVYERSGEMEAEDVVSAATRFKAFVRDKISITVT